MQRGVYATNAISFKFKDGVITGVDTGATYGYLAVQNIQQIFQPTSHCLIAFTGLVSDIQFLTNFIAREIRKDTDRTMDPQGIHKMIQRILYEKRSEAEPMEVSVIVSGVNRKGNAEFHTTDERGRMIGVVNAKGNFWFDESVALSFSTNFVLPLLREQRLDELERGEAIRVMEECFRVLCYKDCRSTNQIQIGIVEEAGAEVLETMSITTDWMVGKAENEEILL